MNIKLTYFSIDGDRPYLVTTKRAFLISLAIFLFTGCAHTDPYENYEKSKVSPADPRRLVDATSTDDLSTDLPLQRKLKEADDLQLALRYSAKQIGEERNLYDGAFWVTAPYLVYNPAPRNLVRAAAAFGGGYAFLNSRPKEMPQLYDQAAKQISCIIVEYQRFVYPANEISEMKTQLRKFHSAYAQFQQDSDALVRSISKYAAVRTGPICALQGAECREREKVLGVNYSGGSNSSAFEKYFDSLSRTSLRKLNLFEDLIYKVEEGLALDVAASVHKVMKDLGSELREKQQPLTLHVFGPQQAPVSAALSAQSRLITDSALKRPLLTKSGNGALNQRTLDAEFQLKMASLNYEHYEFNFQRRKSAGKKLMSSMSCGEIQISAAPSPLPPAIISNSVETPLPGAPNEQP